MTDVHFTLNNFFGKELLDLLPSSELYEFTANKVFRRKVTQTCSCGHKMVHNGYNYARKKGLGKVRIGKQICPICDSQFQEDKQFWKDLLSKWYDSLKTIICHLRNSDVSWKAVSTILSFIFPISKDSAHSLFDSVMEQYDYPQDNYLIVNYDEQHPKSGRHQYYRLTLLNYKTKIPIAEELFEDKEDSTIKDFLERNLDTSKELILIVDCDRRYPRIFKELWGNKLKLQKCLTHLNKLIVGDFGSNLSLTDEYNKYQLLNIFYNREAELRFLRRVLKKEQAKKDLSKNERNAWVKEQKQKFKDFVKDLERKRRRENKNLKQRKLFKARQLFEQLWEKKNIFPKKVIRRLKKIKNNWKYFTTFYYYKDCPATNNAIENYYSTSLKTHRKKQMRTKKGINHQMKLTAMKREGKITPKKQSILRIFQIISMVTS